jgi:hypothetical protein
VFDRWALKTDGRQAVEICRAVWQLTSCGGWRAGVQRSALPEGSIAKRRGAKVMMMMIMMVMKRKEGRGGYEGRADERRQGH